MRGLSFLKCADALLDVKVKPNAAGVQKFYDKAQEYIERANSMNKPENDKPGYKEWEEFCALIQVNWKNALEGKLPRSTCDHAAACLLLQEALDRIPSRRCERMDGIARIVDQDVFSPGAETAVPTDDATTRAYFLLYHAALERAKGLRTSVLAQVESNAELEAIAE